MINRLRTFWSPETVEQLQHPTLPEALALWLLGTLWALLGLWLALRGEIGLVPLVLAVGLVAIAGLKRDDWLPALPAAAVIVTAVDQTLLMSSRRPPAVAVLDLLVLGLSLVAIARRLAVRHGPAPGVPPPDRLLPLPLAGAAVVVLPLAASLPFGAPLRLAVLGLALFHAACAGARRAASARGTLTAFSLAAAWCGGVGLSAAVPAFAAQTTLVSGPGAASAAAMACALPMAWAAAIESKRNRWWRAAAALIGTVGLGSSLVQGTTLAALPIRLDEPRVFSLAVLIAWGAMRLTRLAHAWRKGPVVERVALAATFLIAGPLLVLDVARAGIWVVVLVALASGATAVATPLPAGRPA